MTPRPEACQSASHSKSVDLTMSGRPLEPAKEVAVSQADLATMIGASRQTLNVLRSRLERLGLVRIKFRHSLDDRRPLLYRSVGTLDLLTQWNLHRICAGARV
jgi:Crp-like helix-turn-helix domain